MCANRLSHLRPYGCCPTAGCTEVTADCTAYLVDPRPVGFGAEPNPHSIRSDRVPGREAGQEAGRSQGGAAEDSGVVGAEKANAQTPAAVEPPEGTWVPAGWPIGDTQILLVAPPGEEQQGGAQGVATRAPSARGVGSTAAAEEDCDGGLLVRVLPGGGGEEEVMRLVPAAEGSASGGGGVGEVWVAGSCLSGGYLGDSRVGGSRFVRVELSQRQAERCVVHGGSGQAGRMGEAVASWRQGQVLGLGQKGQQQGEEEGSGEGEGQGQARRQVRRCAVYFRTGDLGRFDAGAGEVR